MLTKPSLTLKKRLKAQPAMKRKRAGSWQLRGRMTQLASRPDTLMAQPARYVSASLVEE